MGGEVGVRGMRNEEQMRCEDKENRLKIHLNLTSKLNSYN